MSEDIFGYSLLRSYYIQGGVLQLELQYVV